MLAGRDRRELDLRMGEEELDQDFTGVTGGTDDTDFHGKRTEAEGEFRSQELSLGIDSWLPGF
jgi:hypothetical protein